MKGLIKISDWIWEIPVTFRSDMRVPARIFASEEMLRRVEKDHSIEQLVNVATLPGVVKTVMVMPDVHEGYGFPIGGIAATLHPDGVISPGGIGYDINCGVRLIRTPLKFTDAEPRLEELTQKLYQLIPSGVGKDGNIRPGKDFDRVLKKGARWAVENGLGFKEDLRHTESGGCLPDADPDCVSDRAKERGRNQIGTIGAGNHFVEVDRVDKIYDESHARAYGLAQGDVVVLIHTGSRGLGHQVATDSIKEMIRSMAGYGIRVPDRELACAPFSSPEGTKYFRAMSAAANFAWANRQAVTHAVRGAFKKVFGSDDGLDVLYDVAHNIAKLETHNVNGSDQLLIVHRKGATRAYGPGHPELPEEFHSSGQPVLIPGSMGTASYVLAGTVGGMEESFGSTCHGAGRAMSRTQAKREVQGRTLLDDLKSRGIHIQAGSLSGIAEEAPAAYKDVHEVVNVVDQAGIAKRVARLRPIAVIKG